MKPRVFLPQEPAKMVQGVWVSTLNIQQLFDFGDPVVCLPPGRMVLNTAPSVMAMREKLADFNDDDFVVGIGDPALIGIACALAAHSNRGKFKMLKWDRDRSGYIPLEVNIYQRLGVD